MDGKNRSVTLMFGTEGHDAGVPHLPKGIAEFLGSAGMLHLSLLFKNRLATKSHRDW